MCEANLCTDKEQLYSCFYKEERAMCLYSTSSPSSPSPQAAHRLPAKQDLLLPLVRPEFRICPRGGPWKEGDGWRRLGCVQDWRPDQRPAWPQWAARLHHESGPGQLQGEWISRYCICANIITRHRHGWCMLLPTSGVCFAHKICDICYRLLCSCCPTAFSWLSPPCSPRSSPQRPTAPLINSCAPCPWLSLRNTVELPRGVARDHVALGAKWNNKLHTAQTCDYRVLFVSNSVLICDSICISPITLYGRVLLPHRALMTERNRHCFIAPRNWDGRHREPAVVTHTILFMDGFNCNTQASLDRQQTFSCGSHPVNLVV